MSAPKDDLEAVRTIIEAVKDFESDEQQRIFRWAAENSAYRSHFPPPQNRERGLPKRDSHHGTISLPLQRRTSPTPRARETSDPTP